MSEEMSNVPEPETGETLSDLIDTIRDGLVANGEGQMVLTLEDNGDWVCGLHFGREAEDSPMAGGAAYGLGATAREAMAKALEDTGWTRRG